MLQQSPEVWADAVCIDVRGSALLLTLLDQPPAPILSSALPTRFEAATQAGILWAEGLLTGPRTMELNGVAHQVWKLEFDAGGLHWKNQREHYRVNLTLKGEVSLPSPSKHSAGTEEAGHSGQE